MDTRFHAVYLLASDDPQCAGMYYVGYTVDPLRRLQQHNGEKTNGAWRTSRKGQPWRMVCCVSGFSEDRAALKFEWMWQHGPKSLDIRDQTRTLLEKLKYKGTAAAFTNKGMHRQHLLSHAKNGLCYAIGLLHILLRCELFKPLMLQLNILEPSIFHAEQKKLPQDVCPPLVPSPPLFTIRDPITEEELKALASSKKAELDAMAAALSLSQQHCPNLNSSRTSPNRPITPVRSQASLSQQSNGIGNRSGGEDEENETNPIAAVTTFAISTTTLAASFAESPHALTKQEDAEQLAMEASLASQRLLPCGLCGLALPPYRYVRCTNLRRFCDPTAFLEASNASPDVVDVDSIFGADERNRKNTNTSSHNTTVSLSARDVILGGPSGRCSFRAHTACAALWFYYSRRKALEAAGEEKADGAAAEWADAAEEDPSWWEAPPQASSSDAYASTTAAASFSSSQQAPKSAIYTIGGNKGGASSANGGGGGGGGFTMHVDEELRHPALARWDLIPKNPIYCPYCFVSPPATPSAASAIAPSAVVSSRLQQPSALRHVLHWSVLSQEAKRSIVLSRHIEQQRRKQQMTDELAAQRQRLIAAGLLEDDGDVSNKRTRRAGGDRQRKEEGASKRQRDRDDDQRQHPPRAAMAETSSSAIYYAHSFGDYQNDDFLDELLGLNHGGLVAGTNGRALNELNEGSRHDASSVRPPPQSSRGGPNKASSALASSASHHFNAQHRQRARRAAPAASSASASALTAMMSADAILAMAQAEANAAANAWRSGGGEGGLGAFDDEDVI